MGEGPGSILAVNVTVWRRGKPLRSAGITEDYSGKRETKEWVGVGGGRNGNKGTQVGIRWQWRTPPGNFCPLTHHPVSRPALNISGAWGNRNESPQTKCLNI